MSLSPSVARRSDLRISVALATCQGERFLQTQLDSLAEQTVLPYELVISDDASTDGTLAIIERFAETAPFPVRLTRNQRRLGVRENFIQTACNCSGDVIAFCDQDDYWHPDKLMRCITPFSDPDVTMVCHDANIVTADCSPLGLKLVRRDHGEWKPSKRPLHLQYGLTMVFRRELNDHRDLWSRTVDEDDVALTEHATHDQWYYFLAVILGEVVNIDECLLDYRQHSENVIGAFTYKLNMTPRQRAVYYGGRAKSAAARIDLLRELKRRAKPKFQPAFAGYIRNYEKAVRIYRGRASVYGGACFLSRLAGMVRTLRAGGYKADEFGTRAVLPDALFGVVRYTPGRASVRMISTLRRSPSSATLRTGLNPTRN